VGNSRGARKLAQTPHANNKKKSIYVVGFILFFLISSWKEK
jgi:hypothetical protein